MQLWKRSTCAVSQVYNCCLAAEQRDKQAGFYWENLLSGMVLCSDIKDNHIYQRAAKHPKWAWRRTKAAASLEAKVTGGWWCTCHRGGNDPPPGQNPREDTDLSGAVEMSAHSSALLNQDTTHSLGEGGGSMCLLVFEQILKRECVCSNEKLLQI